MASIFLDFCLLLDKHSASTLNQIREIKQFFYLNDHIYYIYNYELAPHDLP